jgi:hypothetical protein
MSKKQPTIFWPKRRDIAALLAGTAPEGEGDYDEDGLDKTGEHWCYLDPNAIEVANAYAMGWTATIHARPTTRGIQWAIDAGEDGIYALDPEYTNAPITADAIMEAFREAGLHETWEYEEEGAADEVGVQSAWYRLKV